jgi:hypothetical protein
MMKIAQLATYLLSYAMCDFLIIFYKRIEGEIEKAYLQYN